MFEGWGDRGRRRVESSVAWLRETIGHSELAAAQRMPAVVAQLDQHAAAVRDILTFGVPSGRGVDQKVLLAGYGRGLVDRAAELGRPVGRVGHWAHAEWLDLRLAAVCLLADEWRAPGWDDGLLPQP
ncbi:DUF6401 family natural product biosynthesis protein [Kribbella sp. CA-294648]|uniref:DUF6401 family natural product biosynthesis protein n=1 Tax=Kribbella sp. CA-294648 TaxID=3239948 RepID=UPI003D914863